MKTEPTISIQDEVAKIHAQYGMTEMANYRIEKLFEKYVKQFSPELKKMDKNKLKGAVASELIIVAMETKGKRPTQLNFEEMIDVVTDVVNKILKV